MEIVGKLSLELFYGHSRMTAEEFCVAFYELVGPDTTFWPMRELEEEVGVPWQEIRKARREGCSGALARLMEMAVTAKRAGRPWRRNEVAIVVRDGQFVLDI